MRLISGFFTFAYSLFMGNSLINIVIFTFCGLVIVSLILKAVLGRKLTIKLNIFDLSLVISFVILSLILSMSYLLNNNINNINIFDVTRDNSYLYRLPIFYFVFVIVISSLRDKMQFKKWILISTVIATILISFRFVWALYHYQMGSYYVENNQIDNAIREYKKAKRVLPSLSKANLVLGELYMKKEMFNKAIVELEEYKKNDPQEEKQFSPPLKNCYIKTEAWDKMEPLNSDGVQGLLFEDYYQLGQELAIRFDFESAIHELEKIEVSSPLQHYKLGKFWYEIGVYDKVIEELNLALGEKEKFKDIDIILGNSYLEAGNYKEAMCSFKNALKLTSNSINALYGLGQAYEELGRKKEAIPEYEKVLKLDSQFAYIHTSLEELYKEQKLLKKAEEFFRNKSKFITKLASRNNWQSHRGWKLSSNYKATTEIRLPNGEVALWISARGKPAQKIWPIMVVGIDEKEISKFYVKSTDWKKYVINFIATKGRHKLWVRFINDRYLPDLGEDRNLYVGDVEKEIL